MQNITSKIKQKENPNDKFYTPISLVKLHLKKFQDVITDEEIIYEPFYGIGNYYKEMKNLYPNAIIKYSEIDLGLDFFDFNEKVDYIISNPPYSLIDKVLEHSVKLKPKIISYLIGLMNLTTKRIEYMNKNNYFVMDIHFTKVYKWFGMSIIITFSNEITENKISFDRIVHK
jgi:type I restriction-modification system DNA methylase subunit